MRPTFAVLLLLSVGGASTAAAAVPPETLTPGVAVALPGKGPLPRRTNSLNLAMTGSLLAGDSFGAEAAGELRLMEAFGIGLGVTATDVGQSAFLRMTP